jgi:hypothetical protein
MSEPGGRVQIFGNLKKKIKILFRKKLIWLSCVADLQKLMSEPGGRVQIFGNNLKKKNQNSIQKEIKSRLKSRNACCHSVQNFCLPVC